jgi:hypothetical protein
MYTPKFPYTGNQVIITSGRVTHHSYDDFIFLFGKKGVAISSPSTFTVDANEKTIIASPKIELGFNAIEPVLLGRTTAVQLVRLFEQLKQVSDSLNQLAVGEEDTAGAIAQIVSSTKVLSDTIKNVNGRLQSECLSNNTYTR